MLTYVLRRVIMIPVTLLGVTLLVFSMMQLLNPYQLLSAYVSSPAELKGQNIERLITKYGLDQPLPVKYARCLWSEIRAEISALRNLKFCSGSFFPRQAGERERPTLTPPQNGKQ